VVALVDGTVVPPDCALEVGPVATDSATLTAGTESRGALSLHAVGKRHPNPPQAITTSVTLSSEARELLGVSCSGMELVYVQRASNCIDTECLTEPEARAVKLGAVALPEGNEIPRRLHENHGGQ
jgi:hypothetical protein